MLYNKWELTRSFLTMSNDAFFKIYGFNWVPPQWMQEKVKKEIIKENEKNNEFYIPEEENLLFK